MQRTWAVQGVEHYQLWSLFAHQQTLPFCGTLHLLVYHRRRRPKSFPRGIVALHQMHIHLVVDHDVALQKLLGHGVNQPLIHFWGFLRAVYHGVEQRTYQRGWHTLHVVVNIVHHMLIKQSLRGAYNHVVVQWNIVKIVSHKVVETGATVEGVALLVCNRHFYGAYRVYHLCGHAFGMIVNQCQFYAVEPCKSLFLISRKGHRIQLAFCLAQGGIYCLVVVVIGNKQLVLSRPLHLHVTSPVALGGVESKVDGLVIIHKLYVSAFGIGEKVQPRKHFALAFKHKSPMPIVHSCVAHVGVLCVIVAHEHYRVVIIVYL